MQSLSYVEIDIPEFPERAASFNGSNVYLTRDGGLTGAADSKQLTISFWIKRNTSTGFQSIITATNTLGGGDYQSRFELRDTTNFFAWFILNSAGTTILQVETTSAIPFDEWTHIIGSFDLTSTSKRWVYVNGVLDAATYTTYTNDTGDFTKADWAVGGWPNGGNLYDGDIADLWFAPGVYIDLSIEANLRKFVTASRGRVDLGDDGDIPTGSSPLVFLSGPFNGWVVNKGTGGGFTEHGETAAVYRTYRFAIDTSFLPKSIYAIPNIISIEINPATLSLGVDLGQRATVTVKFKDHRHIWDIEDFGTGTIWGKFRARYGLKLRGNALRVIRGSVGESLDDMETRNFIIESTDGPSTDGEYRIIAKDVIKFADGDRAQAPVLSNGFLSANITNVATTATLSPSGIGDSEYPASGYVAIGGSEIVSFTRAADVLTITRAQFNTVAAAHTAQDRVQLCLYYNAQSPDDIISDLFINYANVPSGYINTSNWDTEISTFFATVYTALIAEPTSVSKLVSELVEQVGLAIWWDDINEEIKLQVIRAIPTNADVFDQDVTMAGTLDIAEQPDQRLTDIYFYFGKINPLVNEDQINNYRSTALVTDSSAIEEYGSQAIKKIFSRWLAVGGRTVAEAASENILNRYRDPPRHFKFELLRDSVSVPLLGGGYQLEGWPLQDADGVAVDVPIQITRVNPMAERFVVEADEMLSTFTATPDSPGAIPHTIVIDSDLMNVDMRTMHDSVYSTPVSGNLIICTINAGIVIGSTSTANPAFDVGTWPGGVSITLRVNGRIEGCGGMGGTGGLANGQQTVGLVGGTALYTRQAISVEYGVDSEIWGGGGGGGGGGGSAYLGIQYSGGGGGGGAGRNGGAGGDYTHLGGPSGPGAAGTDTAGGTGGINAIHPFGNGGDGGGPGLSGSAGSAGNVYAGAAGGAAGAAIDGVSYRTVASDLGVDIRGSSIN